MKYFLLVVKWLFNFSWKWLLFASLFFSGVTMADSGSQPVSFMNARWEVFTAQGAVSKLLIDNGVLWVGTDKGLEQWDTTTKKMVKRLTVEEGLPSAAINVLLSDGQSGLWVGTNKGLLHLSNQGGWQVFNIANSDLPANAVFALIANKQGSLWVGTEGGLARLNVTRGEWVVYTTEKSGLPDNAVFALAVDDSSGVWIGTQNGGLAYFSPSGQWMTWNRANSKLPDSFVTALQFDSEALWVGTRGKGVALYGSETWSVYDANNGMPGNSINGIVKDDNGFWLATEGGVVYRDRKGNWSSSEPSNAGLLSNQVATVALDGNGGVWLGVGNQLAHISFSSSQSTCSKKAAILIAGGPSSRINSLWDATESTFNYVYKTFNTSDRLVKYIKNMYI